MSGVTERKAALENHCRKKPTAFGELIGQVYVAEYLPKRL